MGSPGPVSVAHTTAGELTASFIHYPTSVGLCGVIQDSPGLNIRVNRAGSPGQKRPFARSVSSVLSDSDGDVSEDKSTTEWSARSSSRDPGLYDEELRGSQIISGLTYRSNKCRIFADMDREVISATPHFDQSETHFNIPMDRSSFSSRISDDPISIDMGPEEVSDLGANGGKLTLWQFLLELLLSNKYRNLIRWTNKKGEFILLQAEAVAKLWGLYKDRNHRMNYDKLSRALRYYYEKNIIRKVHGHKFVYQFMGLRNLIKICQETSNSAISSHPSLDPVLTECTQTETKGNVEWDSLTGTTSNLDSPPSGTFPHSEEPGIGGTVTTDSNNISERLDQMIFMQNGLPKVTGTIRTVHSHSLGNLIGRWAPEVNQSDDTHNSDTNNKNSSIGVVTPTNAAITNTAVQRLINRSPGSDENSQTKVSHPESGEHTEISAPFTASMDTCDSNLNVDNDSSVRVNEFSSLLCSLASFMSTGHWMPRISEPSDSTAAFDLSSSINMITKTGPRNLLLNPVSDPSWMAQLIQASQESLKPNELGRENESTHSTLTRSDVFPKGTQPTSKSPIPMINNTDNFGQCQSPHDHSLLDKLSSLFPPAVLTEQHQTKSLPDPIVRPPSPDCHCSCHSLNRAKSIDDWSHFNSLNTTSTDTINTTSIVQNSSTTEFPVDTSISGLTSKNLLSDNAYSPISNLPVNLARETSPTKLHHQRHAINMQRLGEQLSLISRGCHSHSLSKSVPTIPMNTTVAPETNNSSHNAVTQPASLTSSIARVQLTGIKDNSTSECAKTKPSLDCVPDQIPRFSTTDSGSGSSNGEPCVWMPVPVTMLTSWIRLLSGITADRPVGVCNRTGETSPICTTGTRQPGSELNAVSLIQSHLLPHSTMMDTFPRLKTEPRESDHFIGV